MYIWQTSQICGDRLQVADIGVCLFMLESIHSPEKWLIGVSSADKGQAGGHPCLSLMGCSDEPESLWKTDIFYSSSMSSCRGFGKDALFRLTESILFLEHTPPAQLSSSCWCFWLNGLEFQPMTWDCVIGFTSRLLKDRPIYGSVGMAPTIAACGRKRVSILV